MSSAEQTANATAGEAETLDLLDQVITATRPQSDQEAERAKDYFRQFINQVVKPGQIISKDVEANVKHWIGQIDKVLTVQLNESCTIRISKAGIHLGGLHYLVHQCETGEN